MTNKQKKIRTCPYCGGPVTAKDPRTIYCCTECGYNAKRIKENTGSSQYRLYRIWRGILKRCYDSNCVTFKNYGARGISVCDSWKNSFSEFEKWSLEHGYDNDLTIDRINNDGNYCPENCRWVTSVVQNNNRRNNISITYNGQTLTIAQWAHKLNMDYGLIWGRLQAGNTPEQILKQEKRKQSYPQWKPITYNGITLSRAGWDRKLGYPKGTICNRLRAGLSIEEAITKPIDKRFSHKKNKNS